jgi:hypothetical protein
MLAQQAHFGAKNRFACFAELALPADDAGIECHTAPDQCAAIGLLDNASTIDPHDLRQAVRDARAAVCVVLLTAIQVTRTADVNGFTALSLVVEPRLTSLTR